GLFDEAVDRGKAETGALTDVLGGVEGVEYLVDDVGRNAGAGVDHLDLDIFAGRHALALQAHALLGADIAGADRELAATGHRVACIDRKIDYRLPKLPDVGPDLPEIAHERDVERRLLADQPAQQHAEVRQRFAQLNHLRAQRLLAREGEQLPDEARGPVGVLLDLHDVLKRRIGRPMRVQEEVGRHHDGTKQIVEVVGAIAG